MLRKLLTLNIQRIKSICSIGTMLQQVLLRFRILLGRLVFAKAVSSTLHPCGLNGKDKVIITQNLCRQCDELLIETFLCQK